VELLLDRANPNAPLGWSCSADGAVWMLQDVNVATGDYDGPLCATPLLIPIGAPEADGQLYLDLEADGLVSLVGGDASVARFAGWIVREISACSRTIDLDLVVVGEGRACDEEIDATFIESWDQVAEEVIERVLQSHQVLAAEDWPNTFIGRGHEPDHDGLTPLAIVSYGPPPDAVVDVLLEARPSAVTLVCVGSAQGLARICCLPDVVTFEPVGIAATPPGHPLDEVIAEDKVVDPAGDASDTTRPRSAVSSDEETFVPVSEAFGSPPAREVTVRFLGDIKVDGGKPLKPKATAVVAYLALHRSVTTERLEEACWFGSDGSSTRKRLRDVMAECRDALGAGLLPANRGGSYEAATGLGTDLELFDWHVEAAVGLPDDRAASHLRAALGLVTAMPFSYADAAQASFAWVDFEHHSALWEDKVARACRSLADCEIRAGQARAVIDELRRLAQALPLNSVVIEALMRVHAAIADRAGAERVYKQHAATLARAGLGEPDEVVESYRRRLLDA
jgi:DNA-binding SARP family transcriptional activator